MSATFALGGHVFIDSDDTFHRIVSKRLPGGSWALVATVNIFGESTNDHDGIDVWCELRNGTNIVGGASDRRPREGGVLERRSLTMIGGAQVPEDGGEVSVWCKANAGENVESSTLMMIQVGSFF